MKLGKGRRDKEIGLENRDVVPEGGDFPEFQRKNGKKERKKMDPARKKKVIRRCVAGGLVLVLAGFFVANSMAKKNTLPSVPVVSVERGDIESMVSTSGVVESEISKVYYAPTAVKVSGLKVELGDAVKKGEQILFYDTEDLKYKQMSEDLEAQASENSYQSSMAQNGKNEATFQEASENLANLEIMIQAQKDFINQLKYYVEDERSKRKLELYDEKYRLNRWINNLNVQAYIEDTEGVHASQAQAMNELEEINKKLDALEENKELTEIERQIVDEQEKLADMETYRDELKADKNSSEDAILDAYKKKELEASAQKSRILAEQAQAHLEEAMSGVIAEFNGIVTELEVNESFVTEAGSKLLKLESSDDVRVSISLSKYDLSKVKEGQKAEVTISGQVYQGTVTKINRMAEKNDAGTRLVAAEVHVDNPDDNIYLGIEGKVKIHAQKSEDALLVPIAAVNTDQEGDFCYVVENGIVTMKRVTAGLTSESNIEIVDGLSEGDTVITDISVGIVEGMAVEPLPAM